MISVDTHTKAAKKLAGYLIPVLLTFLFLYFAFRSIDLKKSFSIIAGASLFWICVYIVVFLASHWLRALRWKVMIEPVKKETSILNLFGAVMVGYGVNCVIPRLGELYRSLFLGKWEGISRSSMLGTVIIERIIDIASFAFASLLSVYLFPGDLFHEIPQLKISLMIGFGFILFFILLLISIVRFENFFAEIIYKIVIKIKPTLAVKVKEITGALISGLSSIRSPRNILLILIQTMGILLLYAFNSYVGFYVLGMDKLGEIGFSMTWVFMTISAYAQIFPTPGSTGSYHIISIFVLSNLYHFDYEVSAAYAIITHFISYVMFILSTFVLIYWINSLRIKRGYPKENFFTVFENGKEQ